jgi:transketolase
MNNIATRDSYGAGLIELKKFRPDLTVLDADLSAATKTGGFAKAHPDSFINCGIAEANMMGVAAGLAACGRLVFASSFAMFAAGRAFEIIRNSIAYPGLNVKIGATHAGISVGEDGASHQCNEDIALMRVIPNMTIINPADDVEARGAVLAMANHVGPAYLRFGRLPVPVFNDTAYEFELGKGVLLREGADVTIIATGLMVSESLSAYEILKEQGISARIINIHTIKPIDREIIQKAAGETGKIVTVEEHSVIGGLGDAVMDCVMDCSAPVRVCKIGVDDTFGYSGPALELLPRFGLCKENIVRVVKEML